MGNVVPQIITFVAKVQPDGKCSLTAGKSTRVLPNLEAALAAVLSSAAKHKISRYNLDLHASGHYVTYEKGITRGR